MYSRNYLFITEKCQEELKSKKILIAGVGMGSFVAELLLRTGFTDLIIADGDLVSLSNLNRQNFVFQDLNKNKAEVVGEKLLKINAKAKVKVINKFLTKTDLQEIIPEVDFVINTIDFDSPDFVECSNLCRLYKKIELFPTNLGFGGSVIVFNENSKTFSNYFKETDSKKLKKKILDYLIMNEKTSGFLKEKYQSYLVDPKEYDPQLGVSTFITASLIGTILVKIILKEKIKVFPEVNVLDLF